MDGKVCPQGEGPHNTVNTVSLYRKGSLYVTVAKKPCHLNSRVNLRNGCVAVLISGVKTV